MVFKDKNCPFSPNLFPLAHLQPARSSSVTLIIFYCNVTRVPSLAYSSGSRPNTQTSCALKCVSASQHS